VSERWLLSPAGGSKARAVVVLIAAPVLALGVALLVQPQRELGAVSLFLLAVVGAAVVGGIWAGVGSSLLGFLALIYFFTRPLHKFVVNDRRSGGLPRRRHRRRVGGRAGGGRA
jgi:K+-sensing histidine kinase KdpD